MASTKDAIIIDLSKSDTEENNHDIDVSQSDKKENNEHNNLQKKYAHKINLQKQCINKIYSKQKNIQEKKPKSHASYVHLC